MYAGKTLFAQLMDFLPWTSFERIVQRYGGDYRVHIARAGVTFRYSSNGPEGLLKGRRTLVFITRGGVYGENVDTQTPYLRQFLGFIGLQPEFVFAEGLALGTQSRQQSLAEARARVASLGVLQLAA